MSEGAKRFKLAVNGYFSLRSDFQQFSCYDFVGRLFDALHNNRVSTPGKNKTKINKLIFTYYTKLQFPLVMELRKLSFRGAFDSAKNHKRQRRKRQSVTAKREKSQTPKFV